MNVTTESIAVERELEIAASAETIWELLTDEEQATRWMGREASFDLRPGGSYRVEVIPGNVASGEFLEVDPPRRLAFSWGWEAGSASSLPPGSTVVEFDLTPSDVGTLLRFRHRDLPSSDSADSHAHGWDHYLGRLAEAATGEGPGRDPWLDGPMR
jgi:uncharacterized protein YndB with AHSA1/START domain